MFLSKVTQIIDFWAQVITSENNNFIKVEGRVK